MYFLHALRSLRHARGLTLLSIVTVSLGIAAATALFSVVKAVLLNPLPYASPEQLMWLGAIDTGASSRVSLPDFDDWRRSARSFTAAAAYSEAPVVAGGGARPERLVGAIVTEDFFDVFGVAPALGRVFSADEHRAAPLSAVILGDGLWQRLYGGDTSIIGRTVTVLGRPATVVGVMPRGFSYPAKAELWVSARALRDGNVRTAHNYWVIARRAAGVSAEQAAGEISRIAKRLAIEYANPYQTDDATAIPLATHLVGAVRTPILVLFGAVGVLLAIVCVNVANLLLVRGVARSRELAIRVALGAERRNLLALLFVESSIVAAASGVVGLVLAAWSMGLLRVVLPAELPRGEEIRIDAGVVAFAFAAAALAGILFGTLPAWRSARVNVHDTLKAGSRSVTSSARSQRTSGALVVSEVALSLLLLAGAGFLLDSFARLRAVDPGFTAQGVLATSMSFPVTDAAAVRRLLPMYRELLQTVQRLPGVEAVGAIKDLPLDPIQRNGHFYIENRRTESGTDAAYLVATPGLRDALNMAMGGGRWLQESDSEASAGVVVINREMARRHWPDRDPVGERIWFDSFEPKERWLTIVGVVGDVRQDALTEPVRPLAYVNYAQVQIPAQLGTGNLVVRTSSDPGTLVAPVRQALLSVNPEAAATFRTMDAVMAEATARQRFQMQVLAAFAALSLLLAAVGLYGVLSYLVTSNRAVIGIRLALGATPRDVFRQVITRAMGLTAIGAGLGVLACLALGRVVQQVVFNVSATDPRILGSAIAVMLATALLASWLPAYRAMRVDPITTLREE
jgi:predicted permease